MSPLAPALVLALLTVPGAALAAEGEGSELGHFFWETLNLLLLLGVIVYFARKPVRQFFADRRADIREELDTSARLLREAESRMNEWQERLDRLDAEREEITAAARRIAEAERERILADARASAERIRRDAAAAVDQELRRARLQLRAEASDLAISLAEQMLRDEVTAADRERLLDEFVERIERAEAAGAAPDVARR